MNQKEWNRKPIHKIAMKLQKWFQCSGPTGNTIQYWPCRLDMSDTSQVLPIKLSGVQVTVVLQH